MSLSPARSKRTVGIAVAVVVAVVAAAALLALGLEWRLQRQNAEIEQANVDRDVREANFLKAVAALEPNAAYADQASLRIAGYRWCEERKKGTDQEAFRAALAKAYGWSFTISRAVVLQAGPVLCA